MTWVGFERRPGLSTHFPLGIFQETTIPRGPSMKPEQWRSDTESDVWGHPQALSPLSPSMVQPREARLRKSSKKASVRAKHTKWDLVTCCCSVAQSCLTLCEPTDCSMPGFPVHHQLLELAQTLVHQVSDAIQPSHALSSPSSTAFSLSQHQGLF